MFAVIFYHKTHYKITMKLYILYEVIHLEITLTLYGSEIVSVLKCTERYYIDGNYHKLMRTKKQKEK